MDSQDKFTENDNLNLHSKQHQHQDLSFSFFPFSPTLFENDDYGFFPHHHHDLLVSHCWPVNNPSTTSTATESLAHQDQLDQLTAVTNNKAEVSLNDIKNDDGFAISILDPSNKVIPDSNKISNITTKINTSTKRGARKRSPGKKDRHSKIVTSQGPRDRRMRLSLDIARKFFDLQDILGVDKASKTLEWLLNKSKPAIKEIMRISTIRKTMNDGGSAKESTVSTAWELLSETERMAPEHQSRTFPEEKPSKHGHKEKKIRQQSCKKKPLARELRENARARARERTIQKMNQRLQELKKCFQGKTLR
ncbi:hypothetical protein MKX01_032470 [Papaver californicum]|nr:hypothetical protein MKX01_032470 [Papaver californicum]